MYENEMWYLMFLATVCCCFVATISLVNAWRCRSQSKACKSQFLPVILCRESVSIKENL